MSFGSVTDQTVRPGTLRRVVLRGIRILGEHPWMDLEHLGETNAQFWRDAVAKANADAAAAIGKRAKAKQATVTQAQLEKNRESNRDTMARYSVRATGGFYHDFPDRRTPDPSRPATTEDIPAIVKSLPAHVFDELLEFATNEANWVDTPIAGDPAEIAGK